MEDGEEESGNFSMIPAYDTSGDMYIWKNDNGTVLQTDRHVAPGQVPTYRGDVPVNGPLTHSGWKESKDTYGNTIMTAMFIDGPNEDIGGDEHSIASLIIAIYRSLNQQGLVIS